VDKKIAMRKSEKEVLAMSVVKKIIPVLLITLMLWQFILMPVKIRAGTMSDPEIDDGSDGLDYTFLDIDRVWFDDETNTSLSVFMKMMGGPEDRIEFIQGVRENGTTAYDYEVYFDFNNTHYALVITVLAAFHGPLIGDVIVLYDTGIRTVNYTESGDVESEEPLDASIDWDWDGDNKVFTFIVDKEDIGSPKIGDYLTHTWAAVWNADEKPYDEQRNLTDAIDTAASYLLPGRDYRITGGFQYVYMLDISAQNTKANITPGGEVKFKIDVNATCTNENGSEVRFFASPSVSNWTVKFEKPSVNVSGENEFTNTVYVKAPTDAKNGTKVTVTVYAVMYFREKNVNETLESNRITLKITVVAKKGEGAGEKQPWYQSILKYFKDIYVIAIAAAVIAVLIVAMVLARRLHVHEAERKAKAPK